MEPLKEETINVPAARCYKCHKFHARADRMFQLQPLIYLSPVKPTELHFP